jgi:hypothetical protein
MLLAHASSSSAEANYKTDIPASSSSAGNSFVPVPNTAKSRQIVANRAKITLQNGAKYCQIFCTITTSCQIAAKSCQTAPNRAKSSQIAPEPNRAK